MNILVFLSDFSTSQIITKISSGQGAYCWRAENLQQARRIFKEQHIHLVFLELGLPNSASLTLAHEIRQKQASLPVVGITHRADHISTIEEQYLHQHSIHSILYTPIVPALVEQIIEQVYAKRDHALDRITATQTKSTAFAVRLPLRLKLTFPYAFLALLILIAGMNLIGDLILDNLEERFWRQLTDAGAMAADRMVLEEQSLLAFQRELAFTATAADLLAAKERERLLTLVLPNVTNEEVDTVDFINTSGQSVLSLRATKEADRSYRAIFGVDFSAYPFVKKVLQGRIEQGRGKFAGVITEFQDSFFAVIGPIRDQEGKLVGAVMVGTRLTTLADQLKESILANVTFYDINGQVIVSTLSPVGDTEPLSPTKVTEIQQHQESASLRRALTAGSSDYDEILGSWHVSQGEELGVFGVAMTRSLLIRIKTDRQLQVILLVSLVFLIVIAVGIYLSNHITHPLLQIVRASMDVANGNLSTKVETVGNDEIAALASSFNQMVDELREGVIYRDLLGRSVSTPIREQLRQTFAAGELRLDGQEVMASILMSDIRDFTMLSEQVRPTILLTWLNEYFSELTPLIEQNQGVLNSFVGDSLLAFFGVLPKPLSTCDSAYQACCTALQMLDVITRLNQKRQERGIPIFVTGIVVHSGPVTAGGLGSSDRLHYTVIGDTVNTTSRLEDFTSRFGDSVIIVSHQVVEALEGRRHPFQFERLGSIELRGKSKVQEIYRLTGVLEQR